MCSRDIMCFILHDVCLISACMM